MHKRKFALITGASGLLGPEHAAALAEIGYNLILVDINKQELKKKIINLRAKYPNIFFYPFICDITSEQQVKKLSRRLTKMKIFIDVLVNNADLNPKMNKSKKISGLLESYKIKNLLKEVNVGIIGTFICCKIFGTKMSQKNGGSIINISSDLGITAPDHRVYHSSENLKKVKNFKPIGYSISKHGITGITKYLSTYWAHKNVRCNNLVLGAVMNTQSKSLVKNIKKRVPMQRLARKDEYKKSIQFLASDGSEYMTGQNLIIDGGRTVW